MRREAVRTAKETIDFAETVGAGIVNLWLGQDGFDYPFQTDYTAQWENMVNGIRACADYKPAVRLALEFKPREPRNRSLIDSASTALLMTREIDRSNVGVTIDNGHVLQGGANMAQAAELCGRAGKLFNLHMNDNYAAWDDDMIAGRSIFLSTSSCYMYFAKSCIRDGARSTSSPSGRTAFKRQRKAWLI